MNCGGQQRTIQATCGFTMTGHPQEVNKKILRHRKYCIVCLDAIKKSGSNNIAIPAFDRVAGEMNGWDGLQGIGQVRQMMTTALYDGARSDIILDAKNITTAMKEVENMKVILQDIQQPVIDMTADGAKIKKPKKRKGKK